MNAFKNDLHDLVARHVAAARGDNNRMLTQLAASEARLADTEAQLERESALLTEAKRQNADLMAIIDKRDEALGFIPLDKGMDMQDELREVKARLLRDIYSYAEDQGMETLMDMIDSADSADAAQIVTISEHLDESVNHGWVIEGAWSHVQTPDYWVGSSAWSQDHNRALRFARKQDAEQAAAMMLDGIRVRFCEHAWTARE